MESNFCRQFFIRSKKPITWGNLLRNTYKVKEYLVKHGLRPSEFCITDDPGDCKELRIDIGLDNFSCFLGSIDCDLLVHLREKFDDLYFIE